MTTYLPLPPVNPVTPEPRRRLPRAAKMASAKKQEAEKEETKKSIRKGPTPKKTPADDEEKPKKTAREGTTPKTKPTTIDPDMVPLPPSGGKRSVARAKNSPKPKTTKNTPKKIGRPALTKKKTPLRGKKPEDDDGEPTPHEWGLDNTGRLILEGGMCLPPFPPEGSGVDYYGRPIVPRDGRYPKSLTHTAREAHEKKVIRKKFVKRNKKTGRFEEVFVGDDEAEGGASPDDDDDESISIKVGDTKINVIVKTSKAQKGKATLEDPKSGKETLKAGKKARGRPKKTTVVKNNKFSPWKKGDASIPAPGPPSGFRTFGAEFGLGGPLINWIEEGARRQLGLEGPGINPTGAGFGLGFGPSKPGIIPQDPDPELRKMMSEGDGCDCAFKNPTYPYGENGEGGPGIGYICTCPADGTVGLSRKMKGRLAAPAEPTLEPGQCVYRSGASLFKDRIKPPWANTGYELSSCCEHKLPPKDNPIIWDPTDNTQCPNCPYRPPHPPGNCHCPPKEAFVFTVRAKKQVDGKDNWTPVRNGDILELRGHCNNCDKLVRKDDNVRGIGEAYNQNSKTFQRMMDFFDQRGDSAEEEEAAEFNETLGFNPDGTPKVAKDELVMYKKWNRNGWSDKEVKRAEETRHKQWSTAGANDGDHLTEEERRHKQWSRANDGDQYKPKKGKNSKGAKNPKRKGGN